MIEVTSVRDWQAKVESFQTRQSDVTPGHEPVAFVVISGRKNLRRDMARIVVNRGRRQALRRSRLAETMTRKLAF